MRYHDYHLDKYEVTDKGETITLHLIYDYPDTVKDKSSIKFSQVALYNFTHVGGAIITDIDEVLISTLTHEIGEKLVDWNQLYGLRFWKDSLQNYTRYLTTENYRAWRIESAIGFSGFAIAKQVDECS